MGKPLSKAIIFDFDGTLVDSKKTINECFQTVTKKIAPDRINYAKKILIGPPLSDTATNILGNNHQDKLDAFIRLFIKIHDSKAIFHTHPFPGVSKTLKKLYSNNIHMALATNKRKTPTIKLIEHLNWNKYFSFIECHDGESNHPNKSIMIKKIITKNSIFKNSYYLGDTVNDGVSANLNNLKFLRANYGYGLNEDWTEIKIYKSINSFVEILE